VLIFEFAVDISLLRVPTWLFKVATEELREVICPLIVVI